MKKGKLILVISLLIAIGILTPITLNRINEERESSSNVINLENKSNDNKKSNETDKGVLGATENESNVNSNSSNNESNSNSMNESNTNSSNSSNINGNTSNASGTSNNGGTNTGNGGTGVNKTSNKVSNKQSNSNVAPEESFEIKDKDIIWEDGSHLNVFGFEAIAPRSTGIYEFTVNNKTKSNAKYTMTFMETNEYKANVMYKLKRNGEYIAGDEDTWVYYDELNIENKGLKKRYKDEYVLEWKWIDAENDTEVGIAAQNGVTYALDIRVVSVGVDKEVLDGNEGVPNTLDSIISQIKIAVLSLIGIIALSYILLNRKTRED